MSCSGLSTHHQVFSESGITQVSATCQELFLALKIFYKQTKITANQLLFFFFFLLLLLLLLFLLSPSSSIPSPVNVGVDMLWCPRHHSPCLRQGLLLFASVYTRLADPRSPGILLCAFYLPKWYIGITESYSVWLLWGFSSEEKYNLGGIFLK